MTGNRINNRWLWLALVAGVLTSLSVTGCTPKRVLHTGTAVEAVSAARTVSGTTTRDNIPGTPPGEPPGGLPEPKYRGVSGTSSLRAAKNTPPGTPSRKPLTGSNLGLAAAALAKEQLGKPYQWGAQGPDKFDCSGLVMYVYDNLGVKLPRVSGQQAYSGVHVDRQDLQPGDLVFFKLNGSRINHVGIYLGHNKFVHAPRKHVPVRTESLNNSYWRRRFKGGRRLK